jgi:hypothetical protein
MPPFNPEQLLQLFPQLFFGIAAFIVAAVVIYSRRQETRRKEALEKLSGVLDGRPEHRLFAPGFSGTVDGRRFRIELIPGSRNSPRRLTLAVEASPGFSLEVFRESFGMSLTKTLGLVSDLQTSDPQFNADFVLSADESPRARAFLEDMDSRHRVRSFFDAGFDQLAVRGGGAPAKRSILIMMPRASFEGGSVSALKPNYDLDADLDTNALAERVRQLALLAAAASR